MRRDLSSITSAIIDVCVFVSPANVKSYLHYVVNCWHMQARRRYNFVHCCHCNEKNLSVVAHMRCVLYLCLR
jgi:hypothetical protein